MKDSSVLFIRDIQDPLLSQESIEWALQHVATICEDRGVQASIMNDIPDGSEPDLIIEMLRSSSSQAPDLIQASGIAHAYVPEAFSIIGHLSGDCLVLTLIGNDVQGLVYALLEIGDIVRYAEDPIPELKAAPPVAEQPANRVRSITRLFTSEPEDKPWFYDHAFWDEYLTELVSQRFNRFTFSVGAGYDYLIDRIVLDNYFCFLYPFVLAVPGYDVKVQGLPAEEREKNLEMLRYIGRQCKLRGLEFRLGLWNHAYNYGPYNTNDQYNVTGLDGDNHATYCRDALRLLLQSCPDIQGLTFRVHFEGGVPEPTHEFWKVVMERMNEVDSLVDIDFHSKGVTEELLEILNKTGKDFVLSTKYWAEHMGPPYHQASIRRREFGGKPLDATEQGIEAGHPAIGHHDQNVKGTEITKKRSFTRYGYGDFLRDDRSYGMVHRVWPGTQRILLWGDPLTAAGIGRHVSFCGSRGIEWFEPLSFKGKKGTGMPGGRELYEPDQLKLSTHDWTKFLYTYRLWGRLTYNPDTRPESWRRFLRWQYGDAALEVEQSLGVATRILPYILLVHTPSVANNVYWPEMYSNIPLVRGDETIENPYAEQGWSANAEFDMEKPYTFMNTSPLDPALIYRINEFAGDVIRGQRSGKYSPVEVADQLETMANQADKHLGAALALIPDAGDPTFVRTATDIRIMAGIGHFFARKFRAGLAYALYQEAGGLSLLRETIALYRSARAAWMQVVDASTGIYRQDITFGHPPYARGHWADRTADIDRDITAVERQLDIEMNASSERLPCALSLTEMLAPFRKGLRPACIHEKPNEYEKGQDITLSVRASGQEPFPRILLHYRHVDQSESYVTVEMEQDKDTFAAVIPSAFTKAPYPLMYFFEIRTTHGDAWMDPGLDEDLCNQPYYLLLARDQQE